MDKGRQKGLDLILDEFRRGPPGFHEVECIHRVLQARHVGPGMPDIRSSIRKDFPLNDDLVHDRRTLTAEVGVDVGIARTRVGEETRLRMPDFVR